MYCGECPKLTLSGYRGVTYGNYVLNNACQALAKIKDNLEDVIIVRNINMEDVESAFKISEEVKLYSDPDYRVC